MADTLNAKELDLKQLAEICGGTTQEEIERRFGYGLDEQEGEDIVTAVHLSVSHHAPFDVAQKAVKLAREQGISPEEALKKLGY